MILWKKVKNLFFCEKFMFWWKNLCLVKNFENLFELWKKLIKSFVNIFEKKNFSEKSL